MAPAAAAAKMVIARRRVGLSGGIGFSYVGGASLFAGCAAGGGCRRCARFFRCRQTSWSK
jgi:hypothetical protein